MTDMSNCPNPTYTSGRIWTIGQLNMGKNIEMENILLLDHSRHGENESKDPPPSLRRKPQIEVK